MSVDVGQDDWHPALFANGSPLQPIVEILSAQVFILDVHQEKIRIKNLSKLQSSAIEWQLEFGDHSYCPEQVWQCQNGSKVFLLFENGDL
jgi:hypothetical protein